MCILKPEHYPFVCFYSLRFDDFITHVVFLLNDAEMKLFNLQVAK